MTSRKDLLDVREVRSADHFELRADSDETVILTGYASTFQEYEMLGGPAAGGWIEQLDRHAFDVTLAGKPDLHLLINHAGMPLARTKSGTLDLSVDDHGLKVLARLDRRDPEVKALEVKMSRGDMDEMSFAFRVKAQTWSAAKGYEDDPESHRLMREVSLHKGDVSVVNFGANPRTTAEVLRASRKKLPDGVTRGTLSIAEATSIVSTDERALTRGSRPMSLSEAARIIAADAKFTARHQAAADYSAQAENRAALRRKIAERAEQILAESSRHKPDPEPTEAPAQRGNGSAFASAALSNVVQVMPPISEMTRIAREAYRQEAIDARIAELDREKARIEELRRGGR